MDLTTREKDSRSMSEKNKTESMAFHFPFYAFFLRIRWLSNTLHECSSLVIEEHSA